MFLERLTLQNFQSFGPDPESIRLMSGSPHCSEETPPARPPQAKRSFAYSVSSPTSAR